MEVPLDSAVFFDCRPRRARCKFTGAWVCYTGTKWTRSSVLSKISSLLLPSASEQLSSQFSYSSAAWFHLYGVFSPLGRGPERLLLQKNLGHWRRLLRSKLLVRQVNGQIARSDSAAVAERHVRFGSLADICSATRHVRFTPNSDRKSGHGRRRAALDKRRARCRPVGEHEHTGPAAPRGAKGREAAEFESGPRSHLHQALAEIVLELRLRRRLGRRAGCGRNFGRTKHTAAPSWCWSSHKHFLNACSDRAGCTHL